MKRKKLAYFSSSTPVKTFDLLLALSVFALGTWQIYTGRHHPDDVGWTTSGTILVIAMIACIGLIWHRRRTNYSATAAILFSMQLASFAQDILKWRAREDEAPWPMVHGALAISLLALIIWEETNRRKEAIRDTARESKLFDMEDTL